MKRFPSYPARAHPTGQARIVLAGHHVYLGIHGSPDSWTNYNRHFNEWVAAMAAAGSPDLPPLRPHERLTIAELVSLWNAHAAEFYAGSTELRDFADTLRPLVRLHATRDAVEFGPRHLKALRKAMISGSWRTEKERAWFEKRGRPLGWARGLINQRVNRIKRVFGWAASEEYVPVECYQKLLTVEPLKAGKSSARETAPVRPVAESVVRATLPHLPPVPRVMVELQLLTGMRPGEVCRLTPAQIDRAPVADGEPLAGVWVYAPASHKTRHLGHAKAIVFGPRAQALLAPFLDGRAADAPCFSPQESERRRLGRDPWRPCRDSYRVRAYAHAVAVACEKAGAGHFHPHQIRHSVGSRVQRHAGIDAVRAVLGHSDPKTSLIYAEQDLVTAAEVMREVG